MADSIKHQLFSGVAYTALAKYSGVLISLVVTAILSRLLSPDDFGIVAIATIFIAFFALFTDMGIAPAIIQKKELTAEELSHIFSFTVWAGLLISILFVALSWGIAAYYDSPLLGTLCRLLSINLFFSSATIVPNALFYRDKRFKYIAVRSFVVQLSTGVIAVIAACSGAGLYALLITPILSGILMFLISYRYYPQRLRFTWGMPTLRKIFSYSAYQFLFNVINFFSRNLDKLLIGKYMSMSQLGYYEKSYRLMMLPLQNITQVVTPVIHPIFSDYQNDKLRQITAYERIIRLLAFIGLPLGILLCFTSAEVVFLFFGSQWGPSVPVFRILALSVGIQIILSSSGAIFQAAGDTRSLFVCGLFSATLNVLGILLGIFYFGTLTAVATCILITFAINFAQCYWQMYRVTYRRSLRFFVRQLCKPLIATLLTTLCLLPVQYIQSRMAIEQNILNTALLLTVKCLLSLGVWSAYIQLSHEYDMVRKVKSTIRFR
jgi:PST family polysaccharide transporter